MKKLLSLLLALVMLLSFAACANDDTPPADGDDQQQEEQNGSESTTMNKLADIKAAGELVVGTSADYPPYEFHTEIDGKDTIVGFDISIAQAFADELGVELKLVDMAFESLLISLQNGDFDLVMAGLTPDEKRAKTVDFTDVFSTTSKLSLSVPRMPTSMSPPRTWPAPRWASRPAPYRKPSRPI